MQDARQEGLARAALPGEENVGACACYGAGNLQGGGRCLVLGLHASKPMALVQCLLQACVFLRQR